MRAPPSVPSMRVSAPSSRRRHGRLGIHAEGFAARFSYLPVHKLLYTAGVCAKIICVPENLMPSENCSPTLYATSSTLSASWSAEGRDVLMLQFLATLLQGLARGQGLNAEGVARSWCLSARCLGYSKRMATTGPRREARRERRSPAVAVGRATGRAILALLLALCWLAFGCSGPADTVPSPTSWVTDNAGFLSEPASCIAEAPQGVRSTL